MNTFDIIFVVVLVSLSLIYLTRLLLKTLRGTKKGKGCGHCSSGS